MTSHVVMIPPETPDRDAAVRAEFIADRFSVVAFIVPVVWALWHRLWIEAAVLLLISFGAAFLVPKTGVQGAELLLVALSVLVSLFAGLEGANLRIAALKRRGWLEAGIVDAENADEAAIRFASQAVLNPVARVDEPVQRPRSLPKPPATGAPVMGLLGMDDGR